MKLQVGKQKSPVEDNEYTFILPEDLPKIESASCLHIRLGNTLDFYRNRDDLLKLTLSKIRYGGKISMCGTDVEVLARGIYNGAFSKEQINDMLYSDKASISDCQSVKNILLESGFVLEKTRFENTEYFLEATRPKPNV